MADRSLYSETSSPMPTGLEFLDQYGDRLKQLFDAAIWPLSSVGGTGNAVTASCDPPVIGALVEHMRFAISWAADNTGGMTLSIGGATAVPVLTADGSAMQAGDAVTGSRVMLEYVGGSFRLIGGSPSSGAAAGPYATTITTSGTWVKPTGYADDAMVVLEAWGAGGGGRRDSSGSNGGAAAAGGQGGYYKRREMRYADVPSSVSITIGAGGPGATTVANGSNGGNTTIGTLLTALGGRGGGVGALAAAARYLGTLWWGGTTGLDAVFGGAGGGLGEASSGTTPGGVSDFGGDGGGGGVAATPPTAGSAPGGGGGGSGKGSGVNNTPGANGARGEVRIRIG